MYHVFHVSGPCSRIVSSHEQATSAFEHCKELNAEENSDGHFYSTNAAEYPEGFCEVHEGKNLDSLRRQFELVDWEGVFPEVDSKGCLTGRVIPGDEAGYTICDVTHRGIEFDEQASDAVIAD
jgi:hypothetical protein